MCTEIMDNFQYVLMYCYSAVTRLFVQMLFPFENCSIKRITVFTCLEALRTWITTYYYDWKPNLKKFQRAGRCPIAFGLEFYYADVLLPNECVVILSSILNLGCYNYYYKNITNQMFVQKVVNYI